jgi:hypothetical protein
VKLFLDKEKAKEILGDRSRWELLNMKKALSIMAIFNTGEENQKLEACKVLLRKVKK